MTVPASTVSRRGGRISAAVLAAVLVVSDGGLSAVRADDPGHSQSQAANPMGYQLLTEQEARSLPRAGGMLGMDLGRGQRMNDHGMAFDVMQITQLRRGSPADQAGLRRGDQIIAVNGRLFASLNAFAAYVGSMRPGDTATVDYMPAGAGPDHAQRVAVTVGEAGQSMPRSEMPSSQEQNQREQASTGMSTGTKIAIGAAAVALFGCYRFGCFSSHNPQKPPAAAQNP